MKKIKLGVVMPVVNCLKYSKQTYESFVTATPHHWIIIDNGSTDGTREWAESLSPNVTYIRNEENIGVSKSWNLGMATAFELGCDPVFVINNDLVFDHDTVDNLLKWYGEEGQGKFEFITVTNVGTDPELLKTYERKKKALMAPNFIGFLTNSRTIKRIGWFDEGYEIAYFEDNQAHQALKEECIAAAQVLDAPVAHYGSRAIKEGGVDHQAAYLKNRMRFKEKYGFFPELEPPTPAKEYVVPHKPKLLWCGDAVAPTGFAKVTHSVLNWLQYMWDIEVIGVNHRGDPHNYPYPIYPATVMGRGSPWGEDRIIPIIKSFNPHVVLILNDHWIIRSFLDRLKELKEQRPCTLAYIPVDGKNVAHANRLDELDAAIFYTEFGLGESVDGGFMGNAHVIPHGVDLRYFKQADRKASRKAIFKDAIPEDAFLFGCVNRNQGRKRQDLILYCFKKFLEETNAQDAYLYLHCAPDDLGYNIDQLTTYFELDKKKVLLPMDNFTVWSQVKESSMHLIYNSMDVHLSTTQGEGWGMTQNESFACGIPNILPDYAALGEWAKDAAYMVPVSSFVVNTGGLNTVGGVVDTDLFVKAMIEMYRNPSLREQYSAKSLELAQNENFNWRNIAGKFHSVFVEVYNEWLEARRT